MITLKGNTWGAKQDNTCVKNVTMQQSGGLLSKGTKANTQETRNSVTTANIPVLTIMG